MRIYLCKDIKALIRFAERYKFLPLLIVLLIIFWTPLNKAFSAVFIPVVQLIPDKSWAIQISLLLCIALLYWLNFPRILNETALIGNRRLMILYLIGIHIASRCYGLYYFYGLSNCPLCYLDICYILIGAIEIILFICFRCKKEKETDSEIKFKGFIPDQPVAKDVLDRSRCANVILKEIQSTQEQGGLSNGAFTILLNEEFGAGKSSFFNMLKTQSVNDNIVCLEYFPGLSNGRNDIIESLFRLLGNHIRMSGDFHLSFLFSSYSEIVSGKPAEGILRYILKFFVRKTPVEILYSEIRKSLIELSSPIVVLVDDVDRLDYIELMSLLKLLRNTANFPNLVYVVAADKDHLIDLLSKSEIKSPETYIKKFFNFEFLFPALDGDVLKKLEKEIRDTFDFYSDISCNMDDVIKKVFKNDYLNTVFSNFRDVYRFVNLLTFNLDLLKQNGLLKEISLVDFVNITLLQFTDVYTYKILRDRHSVLLELDNPMTGLLKIKPEHKIADKYTQQMINNIVPDIQGQEIPDKEANKDAAECVKDMHAVADKVLPTLFDATSWLLNNMFNYTSTDSHSICFIDEYFKYFSGKYRKGEYNDTEIKSIVQSDNKKFNEKVETIISDGKDDFLAHKIAVYIRENDFDRINLLEKLMLFFNAYYESRSKGSYYQSKSFYWEGCYVKVLVHSMFTSKYTGQQISESEINRIEDFFESQTDYATTALILSKINISEEYQELISPDKVKEWQKALIVRFINSFLIGKPMDFALLDTIICLDSMNSSLFNDTIAKVKDIDRQWIDFLFDKQASYMVVKNEIRQYFSSEIIPEWMACIVNNFFAHEIVKISFNPPQSSHDRPI